MITPLVIWFFAPLLIGGALGFGAGYALSKSVKHIIKIRHLTIENLKNEKEKQEFLDSLNNTIKESLNNPEKSRTISIKNFIAKEEGIIYTGQASDKGKLSNVTQIDYDSIDYDLDKKLNELDSNTVLLI